MKKTSFIAMIALALVILVGGTYDSGSVETASISIEGMTCGGCSSKVETALSAKSGVKNVSVDFDSKLATVEYYPSKVEKTELLSIVSNAGFIANEASCDYNSKEAKATVEGASCGSKAKDKNSI